MKTLILIPLLLLACSRDVELCDSVAMAAKAKEAAAQCQGRGYDWDECPDRDRILEELEAELGRCQP